jgi:DNA/RNA-binding domain of Phe-tRNA-synthetase-like protein
MFFRHHEDIWRAFPQLAAGVVYVQGIDSSQDVSGEVAALLQAARSKHGESVESELPAIQAWRRAFATLGLKPTQYRCAAESLLRRLRLEGYVPSVHPLVDICNAVSILYAVPIAVFDVAKVSGCLEVRHARGNEIYTPFSGPDEAPEVGEVVFADASNRAHARRWTNRQSGFSAVSLSTSSALIVAEALHETAAADVRAVLDTLGPLVTAMAGDGMRTAMMRRAGDQFDYASP